MSTVFGNSARSGGSLVSMNGLSFGYRDYSPTALIMFRRCITASWSAVTVLRCVPAQTADFETAFRVTVGALVGTAKVVGFTYDGDFV